MNIYTVRKAAEGLACYIEDQGELAKQRGVVIAYDCRHGSPEFALEIARTVGNHGIKAYLFNELHPTPILSFAVRYLYAFAGVMITASIIRQNIMALKCMVLMADKCLLKWRMC